MEISIKNQNDKLIYLTIGLITLVFLSFLFFSTPRETQIYRTTEQDTVFVD